MRYAWTPKFQFSGPTVHSYTVLVAHVGVLPEAIALTTKPGFEIRKTCCVMRLCGAGNSPKLAFH